MSRHKSSSDSTNNLSCLYKTFNVLISSVFSFTSLFSMQPVVMIFGRDMMGGKMQFPSALSMTFNDSHRVGHLVMHSDKNNSLFSPISAEPDFAPQFLSLSFPCSSVFFLKCPNLPAIHLNMSSN